MPEHKHWDDDDFEEWEIDFMKTDTLCTIDYRDETDGKHCDKASS